MKGGDVVLLYALKALADVGALKDTRIIVMLTGDEEAAGRPVEKSRGDMVSAAQRSDLALSFEGAHGVDATVGRRGSSAWALEVSGATGHSSQIFKERMGSGAILEAARILNQFSKALGFGKVGTVDPADRGAGDIAYVSHLISGLDGMGADGAGAHAPGESVILDSMPMLTKRAAILIYRLTRQ